MGVGFSSNSVKAVARHRDIRLCHVDNRDRHWPSHRSSSRGRVSWVWSGAGLGPVAHAHARRATLSTTIGQIALAIELVLTVKLIKWAKRWSDSPSAIRERSDPSEDVAGEVNMNRGPVIMRLILVEDPYRGARRVSRDRLPVARTCDRAPAGAYRHQVLGAAPAYIYFGRVS